MKAIGYARVSTKDQKLEAQIEEITRFCKYRDIELVRVFSDTASGKNTDRQSFLEMMDLIENKNIFGIDTVVVYKIDRIGRSLKNLIDIIETLHKNKVQFVSVTEPHFDTTTPQGNLFFQISGAFAEYERKLIRERSEMGTRIALEKGVRFGRPKKVVDMQGIKMELDLGVSKSAVCRKYKIGRSCLYEKLAEIERGNLERASGKVEV